MLHSYYDTLWQSFPQDHLITLSRLCNLLPVEERLVETIASYSSSEMANKRILNAALSNVKHDSVLLGFCILVEKLIEDPTKSKVIEKLRSGQYNYMCMYHYYTVLPNMWKHWVTPRVHNIERERTLGYT